MNCLLSRSFSYKSGVPQSEATAKHGHNRSPWGMSLLRQKSKPFCTVVTLSMTVNGTMFVYLDFDKTSHYMNYTKTQVTKRAKV